MHRYAYICTHVHRYAEIYIDIHSIWCSGSIATRRFHGIVQDTPLIFRWCNRCSHVKKNFCCQIPNKFPLMHQHLTLWFPVMQNVMWSTKAKKYPRSGSTGCYLTDLSKAEKYPRSGSMGLYKIPLWFPADATGAVMLRKTFAAKFQTNSLWYINIWPFNKNNAWYVKVS